jgi:hypothetical protein
MTWSALAVAAAVKRAKSDAADQLDASSKHASKAVDDPHLDQARSLTSVMGR